MQPPLLLLDHLNVNLIAVHAQISSRKKLLQEMAKLLTLPLDSEVRKKDVYHCLLEREKLGNTGIGNGVALPHSRTNLTDKTILAVITLDHPIDYDSIDRQTVDLAFGLLVPQEASQEHLNLLNEIARMVSDMDTKSELANASTADELIERVTHWSVVESQNQESKPA